MREAVCGRPTCVAARGRGRRPAGATRLRLLLRRRPPPSRPSRLPWLPWPLLLGRAASRPPVAYVVRAPSRSAAPLCGPRTVGAAACPCNAGARCRVNLRSPCARSRVQAGPSFRNAFFLGVLTKCGSGSLLCLSSRSVFGALSLRCAQSSVRSVFLRARRPLRSSCALVLCARPLRSSCALVRCARPLRSSGALVRCARRSHFSRQRVGRVSDACRTDSFFIPLCSCLSVPCALCLRCERARLGAAFFRPRARVLVRLCVARRVPPALFAPVCLVPARVRAPCACISTWACSLGCRVHPRAVGRARWRRTRRSAFCWPRSASSSSPPPVRLAAARAMSGNDGQARRLQLGRIGVLAAEARHAPPRALARRRRREAPCAARLVLTGASIADPCAGVRGAAHRDCAGAGRRCHRCGRFRRGGL